MVELTAMKLKLLLCLALGLIFYSEQPSRALSSSEQITTNDIQKIRAFIKIKVQDMMDGGKKFKVIVTPYDGKKRENIFGCLDVFQNGKLVVRCNVNSRKLAAQEKEVDDSVKDRTLVFEFTVAQDHLADSRFAVNQSYPEASTFDEHWFYLKDFADAE